MVGEIFCLFFQDACDVDEAHSLSLIESNLAGRVLVLWPFRFNDMSVARAAADPSDYSRYYRQFAPRGMRYAYSLLRNSADSEEVVQEAFLRLIKSRDASTVNGSFAPLFFTTIRNLCIDFRRSAFRRKHVSLERLPQELTQALSQCDVAARESKELEQAVSQALASLPPVWADAIKLRMNGELTYQQIATVLECTHSQVRTWIYRARQQLADELRNQGLLPQAEREHES